MAEKPKKSGRQNYDWVAIKYEYVTDPTMTLRKIAEKYEINYKTVAFRSKADDWFATRKKHQSSVVSKAAAKTGTLQAKELAKESDLLQLMKGHMDRMLSDQEQFHRHLTTNIVTGETEERIFDKYDARAIKDSMQALKMIEDMTRSLHNIQKAEALERQKIERERLELEKERLALERERNALRNQNTSEDSNYGVVLIPEVISNE